MKQRPAVWGADPTVRQLVACNPLYGNPLASREDIFRAVLDLWKPMRPYLSKGGARMRLGVEGAHYGSATAEFEAVARPLWGLAPLIAGGGQFADLGLLQAGFRNGTDPKHEEYWGGVGPQSQTMVEMAAIAVALLLSPEAFWVPLDVEAKQRLAGWLLSIIDHPTFDNNWIFFRILVNLALRKLGQEWSEPMTLAGLDRIDSFDAGEGYFRDGPSNRIDYYGPMALHFYGLIAAETSGDAFPEHAERARARAKAFAQTFQHWFAGDGGAIPFGRSLTYRFAQGAFWSACAFAGEEVLPWGRIKGLLLRHLRWWAERPIADRKGVLTTGYAYPNLLMSESYNGPGSSYWAMKVFLVLALPNSHPFWQAKEEEPSLDLPSRVVARTSGFILRPGPKDALALTGGQNGNAQRGSAAKYSCFAYSSAFGVSVPADISFPDKPARSAVDSGMMLSIDGHNWVVRSGIKRSGIDQGMAWGRWQPHQRICVDSWLDFGPLGWHFRLHRIRSLQTLYLAESGFSIDRTGDGSDLPPEWCNVIPGRGFVRSNAAVSGIVDIGNRRHASIIRAAPNTNLLYPRTAFPRLVGRIKAGTTWRLTAVFASPDPDAKAVDPEVPTTIANYMINMKTQLDRDPGGAEKIWARLLRVGMC